MEYYLDEYQRKGGKVFVTSDGFKYFSNRTNFNCVHLRCVLFKKGCKGTAKLNTDMNLIYPKSEHNHQIEDYKSETFALKFKCRKMATNSQSNLREIFNEVTRFDPSAHLVTFKGCESMMFRARRAIQPTIPQTSIEFCDQLPTTNFAIHLKAIVILHERIAVGFFSDKIYDILGDIYDIQFDGSFYVVPRLFYQLFTIFLSTERHSIPVIHCLMTHKDEELYTALVLKIKELLPQLQPNNTMSDWERASRKAFKHVYPETRIYGCWFYYTQAIWKHIQKFGLAQSYRNTPELAIFVRQIMAIPFLPADLIHSTYSCLQIPILQQIEKSILEDFIKYFKKYWLTKIQANELSIFDLENGTNNGAESYHARLKCLFKSSHPRIWNFMKNLNNIIADYDNEISRLLHGNEITRSRKKDVRLNLEHRNECKEKLVSGNCTPWEYLRVISRSLKDTVSLQDSSVICVSDDSEDENDQEDPLIQPDTQNICAICLAPRDATWLFFPCKHANCCTHCTNTVMETVKN